MSSTLEKVFIIVAAGEFLVGILGNGFIGLKNCIMWIRKQKLYLVDFILTSLAWARFSQLCFSIFHFNLVLSSQDIHVAMKRTQVLSTIWIVANHLSTWFATCLAVFYFLRIANFSHPLFLWLKWRTDTTIFVLLLVSVPSLFITLPLPYSDYVFRSQVFPQYERNVTGLTHGSEMNVMIIFTLVSLPPFCLSLISFFLLLLSLWRHTKHIELHIRDPKDPSLEAHFRAMKNVFFFLILFVLYHLALSITCGSYKMLQNKEVAVFGFLLGLLCPSAHSFVLIFGNNQLKKAFFGIFWHVRYCLKREILQQHSRLTR